MEHRTAQQLMEAALNYALLANNNLVLKPVIPAEYELLGEEVKIRVFADQLLVHFLFPNLNESDRHLLVALRLQRYGLTLGVNSDLGALDPTTKHEMARATDKAEISFMQLKSIVEQSAFVSSLTPVQREVLENEFFSIPFQGN